MFRRIGIGAVFSLALAGSACIASEATQVQGTDIVSGRLVKASVGAKKGLVVVFLSATCPCSNSHIGELSALAHEHPDFNFIGVHSNTDESKESTVAYFEKAKLPFSVIQDTHAALANQYKALKTPHAFIVNPKNEIVYRGGVSNSHDFGRADRRFLREALNDLENGRAVKTPEGRTLGCAISRGDKHVW